MDFIKRNWCLLLVVTAFAVVAIVFFNILWGDPNLASEIVAFGTLTLALVTALHIANSNEQEKRRRKEGLLKEIIEWAIDISKCGIDAGIDFFMRCPNEFFETEEDFIKDNDNIKRKETERRYWSRLLSEYLHLSKKSGYIEIITTKKIKKEALDKSIKKLVDELEDQIKVIRQGLTGSGNITTTMINVQRDKLKECLNSAIYTATNLLDEIT